MSLKVDKVQLEIIMKSDTTRAEIMKLEDSAKSLQKQMKGMKKDSEEYAKSSAEYKKVKDRIDQLRGSIELTGKTMRELSNRSKELRAMLNNLTPGSEQWNRYNKELQDVNARMRELRGQAQQTESGFSKLAGGFNKYFGIAGAMVASVTGLSLTFRKLAEDVSKMDDVYSDVMKTTGMTREEVLELNEELKRMDTRTSREQLNALASDAGKLGLTSKEDILAFVEAGNQINVALGEDLGEGAIKNIGKIVGMFERSTEHLQHLGLKEQMLSVGSAINELGASSSASEPYLVQFAGRLGGIATQAGLSIDQILGFGSALDQDMQAVEMSATALQNFIMKIMGDTAKFAQIAGMEVSKFSALMNTDMNGAIKAVLRSMNEQGGLQQLIPMFQEMGLDGARAAQVISAMAGSIDKIDAAQAVANESLRAGVSLTTEYGVKNNNLAAQLDKAKKRFQEVSLELGQSLNPILLKSTNATSYLIKVLVSYPGVIKTLLVAVGLLSSAYVYQYAVKLKMYALDKTRLVLIHAQRVASLAGAAAQALMTGNLIRARAAMSMLNKTMIVNPYVALAAAVTALGVGIYKLATRTDEATKAHREFTKESNTQTTELNNLFEAYKKANEGTKEKDRILRVIKEKYGHYIQNLIDEKGQITDIDAAQRQANKSLRESIALKIRDQSISTVVTKEVESQADILSDINKGIAKEKGQSVANLITQSIGEAFSNNANDVEKGYEAAKKILKDYDLKGRYGWSFFNGAKTFDVSLSQLANSFKSMHKEEDKIRNKFKGLISEATVINELLGDAGGGSGGSGAGAGGSGGSGSGGKTPDMDAAKQVKEAYNKEMEGVEAAHQAVMLQMLTDYRNGEYEDEATWQATLKQQELDYLGEKIGVQRKWATESEDVKKALVDTEIALENKRIEGKKTADETLLSILKATNEARLGSLSELDTAERAALQAKLENGEMSQREYAAALLAIDASMARARTEAAEAYLREVKAAEFGTVEARKKALDEATKAVAKATAEEKSVIENGKSSKIKADEDYQKEREALLDKYGLTGANERYAKELADLKKSNADKLLSDEEYQRAKKKLDLDNLKGKAEMTVQFAGYAADAVNAYHQMEADSLEAAKQRELTAAGDNADARAKIEKDYAQKELDLKKKQANADAGIKIAQAVAAGALAAIQAFAQLGPIGGAIAAVMIATTTAFQVSSIMKQRQAILATTLDSSASGGSDSAGARVGNSQQASEPAKVRQRASGSWDVVGADDGRTYRGVKYGGAARTGVVSAPTLMGERGDELIVDNPTLRNIRMNAPHLIGEVLRHRVPQRASGNYGAVGSEAGSVGTGVGDSSDVMREVAGLLRWLKENRIESYMVFSEFEKSRALYNKSEQHGNL